MDLRPRMVLQASRSFSTVIQMTVVHIRRQLDWLILIQIRMKIHADMIIARTSILVYIGQAKISLRNSKFQLCHYICMSV